MPQEMTLDDLYRFLDLFDELAITVWIDGGWGVDALLSGQTRTHADLDIIIQSADAVTLRDGLFARGFDDVHTNDHQDWNYVMGNDSQKLVDFHLFDFAEDGRGIYGPVENGVFIAASSLQATGTIGGRPVKCLSAEYQVSSHTGYRLKETDIADVSTLCQRFDIPLPEEYRSLRR